VSALRILAVVLGLSLIAGEAYRSWGAGRHPTAWLDDMFMGGLLLVGAWLLRNETPARRAFFTGAWAVSIGALWGSFFGKVFAPQGSNPGNFDMGVLTILVGLAFATSLIGFVWSLILPFKTSA